MSRKKKKHGGDDVKLNLAAMLDMAFQLLTFFILTFKSPPVEGQVDLRLPPPQIVATVKGDPAGNNANNTNPIQGVETLTITVTSTPNGSIDHMAVGEGGVSDLRNLDQRLKAILQDPVKPFEQVIIQVGPQLRYEELMRVIDVCTKQTFADGKPLKKISFVEIPEG